MDTYQDKRKDYLYYKCIKNILRIISKNQNSILDVGSNGIDLISDLKLDTKVSLDLTSPLVHKNVTAVKENYFSYDSNKKFDIITCCQVIEHVKNANLFSEKLLSQGKIVLISLPYKWKKNKCKEHIQDPINKNKIHKWFKKKPQLSIVCTEKDYLSRIICLYGDVSYCKKELSNLETQIFYQPRTYIYKLGYGFTVKSYRNGTKILYWGKIIPLLKKSPSFKS